MEPPGRVERHVVTPAPPLEREGVGSVPASAVATTAPEVRRDAPKRPIRLTPVDHPKGDRHPQRPSRLTDDRSRIVAGG